MKPTDGRARPAPRILARFVSISWLDLAVSFGPILLVAVVALWIAIRLLQPAPPNTLTISAGPEGGSFWNAAQKYKEILARNGVTLRVLPSEGALQNLERLSNPADHVDIGFVQSGLEGLAPVSAPNTKGVGLMSLGSIGYVPLVMFYKGPVVTRLSEINGERLAIGPAGSGTRQLVLTLLKANGIEPGTGGATEFLPLAGSDAANALIDGKIDVAFLTGDSVQPKTMIEMTHMPGIRVFDFTQAEAYSRRFPYLTKIEIPMGAFDLGKNLPPRPIDTMVTTAELVARDTLHPALSDLLIEAAQEVHGHATLLQHAGEFPAPIAHDFPLSDDAARYYKSGKSFLYRTMPFWVASLADRLLVVLVPIIVVLIPGLRFVPALYGWRVRSRIYRWYGALIAIERSALNEMTEDERAAVVGRLDAIEDSVNQMKMPLAYADQFYVLREHIGFVRRRLAAGQPHAVFDEPSVRTPPGRDDHGGGMTGGVAAEPARRA
jgi:TRAP-type uncharacterized transport system substrate-binding protein